MGVPEITPVELFSVSPAGSDPDETDQVLVPTPPVDASVALYVLETFPLGMVEVVEVSRGLRVKVREAGALVLCALSCTVTATVAVPESVGVPEITPVELLSNNPTD